MTNYRFERAARLIRFKALLFTALFHFVLIGGITYLDNDQLEPYMPETVKEWLGMEETEENDYPKP